MISATELRVIAANSGVHASVVTLDYCQAWLLDALIRTPLREVLVFKGGTALKKCYFTDYRFSEDLDFTCLPQELPPIDLQAFVDQACAIATDRSGITFSLAEWNEYHPAPGGAAFQAKVVFEPPGGGGGSSPRIRLDLTYFEEVVLSPALRPVLHPYPDAPAAETAILTYQIEEIVAEKLRAVLQQADKRPRPRDYFDLWQLLVIRRAASDAATIRSTFDAKCRYKNVAFASPADFFDDDLLEKSRSVWEATIGRQARLEHAFDDVIAELRPAVERLFGGE